MKALILSPLLILGYCTYSQNESNTIEMETYTRYDKYPMFSYAPNSTQMHNVDAAGTSVGVGIAYRFQMQQRFSLKAGIGYFRYSFDKLRVYDPIFGQGDARLTLYMPQNTRVYLATPRYWYNCISLNIVPEYHVALGTNWLMITGLCITNYLTFSQIYSFKNIPNAEFAKFRYQGNSISGQFSFLRQSGKVEFGPRIIVPFFDSYKQDNFFPSENFSRNRSKWLRGLGLGISCAYSLSK